MGPTAFYPSFHNLITVRLRLNIFLLFQYFSRNIIFYIFQHPWWIYSHLIIRPHLSPCVDRLINTSPPNQISTFTFNTWPTCYPNETQTSCLLSKQFFGQERKTHRLGRLKKLSSFSSPYRRRYLYIMSLLVLRNSFFIAGLGFSSL